MARVISLNARHATNASSTDEIPVMLAKITHPSLSEPIYLSTDPTELISRDPLQYGTRHLGIVHGFVLMSAILPDDQKGTPPQSTLIFENVERDMANVVRSITPGTYATIDLTVVFAASPDVVEARFNRLRCVRASYDAAQVSLDVSREPFTSEPMPEGRMTSSAFPSLFQT